MAPCGRWMRRMWLNSRLVPGAKQVDCAGSQDPSNSVLIHTPGRQTCRPTFLSTQRCTFATASTDCFTSRKACAIAVF